MSQLPGLSTALAERGNISGGERKVVRKNTEKKALGDGNAGTAMEMLASREDIVWETLLEELLLLYDTE